MSYGYRVVADYPIASFPLNPGETTTFADTSGNAVASTVYGTPGSAPPLVTGGGQSYIFSNTNGFSFLTSVFTGTNVAQEFSIEAWFKPGSTAGNIQILGHDHAGDGITYDGEAISFTTLHGAAGSATCSWYPQDFERSFYVVGVHTNKMNQLYVNGVLRAQANISDAQRAAGYTVPTNPGRLYVGHAISGARTALVDSVAVYNKSLTQDQISAHFDWGTRVPDYRDVAMLGGGNYWSFLDADAYVNNQTLFFDDFSWSMGQIMNAAISGNMLMPVFNGSQTTVAGQWTFSLPMAALGTTIGGSKIEWDGDGNFVVDVSLNNESTWATCTNGREIPGIVEGYAPGSESLTLRVSFAAGEPLTTISRLRTMSIKFYEDRNPRPAIQTRTFDLVGAASLADDLHQPLEMHDEAGVEFSGGYAIVSADTTAIPTATKTIAMWVKPAANATAQYIFDGRNANSSYLYWTGTAWSFSGLSLYVNGQSVATNSASIIPNNQWSHLVMVLTATTTSSFTIGGKFDGTEKMPMQVATMTIYPQTFTATDALLLYNTSLGIVTVSITDTQPITIREAVGVGEAVKMYQYNWTVANST